MNSNEILKRLKKNDEKAFEMLFQEYYPVLREYAKFYTKNGQIAEDIVQDVFYKIWVYRQNLNIHTSLKSYLYKSVHNRCIEYLRHLTVSQKHDKYEENRLREAKLMNRLFFESGLDSLFEKEIKELVQKSLSTLPQKTKRIFLMSRNGHVKNADIAKKMNLSEKSIEYHISKVLEILRKDLKDYLPMMLFLLSSIQL